MVRERLGTPDVDDTFVVIKREYCSNFSIF